MQLKENTLYHIYNQGNNKMQLFYSRDNYLFFLKLIRKFVFPKAEILAYSIMPNHYHMMIYTNEKSVGKYQVGNVAMSNLSNSFRLLQSAYTLAFNKLNNRTGSLFRQKTKFKCIDEFSYQHYDFICFNYIHQNPYNANLCEKLEDWEYSSFKDYVGLRNGTLINKELACEILEINENEIYEESYKVIAEEKIKALYI
jgi:REP element-mobilizing transposase RayT